MTTALEERVAREEARGEQLDTRLGELREDMRAGFDRVDRSLVAETTSIREDMRAGFERTDRAIDRLDRTIEGLRSEFNAFRNLMIGGMITLGIGMVILFLTIILRPTG